MKIDGITRKADAPEAVSKGQPTVSKLTLELD